jgi:hypothetical protein
MGYIPDAVRAGQVYAELNMTGTVKVFKRMGR